MVRYRVWDGNKNDAGSGSVFYGLIALVGHVMYDHESDYLLRSLITLILGNVRIFGNVDILKELLAPQMRLAIATKVNSNKKILSAAKILLCCV